MVSLISAQQSLPGGSLTPDYVLGALTEERGSVPGRGQSRDSESQIAWQKELLYKSTEKSLLRIVTSTSSIMP